jgi:hypothetical protein
MSRNLAASLIVVALCCAQESSRQLFAQISDQSAATQDVSPPRSDSMAQREFRFLSTNKISTMEKELNDFAAQRFRLERVSRSLLDDQLATLVARDPAVTNNLRYEYRLVATRRSRTMEKEITEAAGQGFEIRALTPMFRPGVSILVGDEMTVVLERPAGETARRYEYKLLSTKRENTMQKDLDDAVTAGYVPLEMLRGQSTGVATLLLGPEFVYAIILGRHVGSPPVDAGAREYKFLATSKVGTMEREMNQAAKEGYRFYLSAPDLLILMFRKRGANGAAPYQYKLLATQKTGTMQKELTEQIGLGYKYLATTSGLGELTTILERDPTLDPKSSRRDLKLLATSREKTTQKEITEALAAGYEILDLTTIGEFIIVLDRKVESRPAK